MSWNNEKYKKQRVPFGDMLHISQVIDDFLKKTKLQSEFSEATVMASWREIVGSFVASQTKKMYVRNKVLFIMMKSPAARHNMSLCKDALIRKMCQRHGEHVIKEIVLI